MTSTEILLAILFSPFSLLIARVIRPREDDRGWTARRIWSGLALLALVGMSWIALADLRAILLLLIALVVPLLWFPESPWDRTLCRLGRVQAILLAPFAILFSLALLLFATGTTRTTISPDGRWEVRWSGEYEATLSLAPRGLVTWDPHAYPWRTLDTLESRPAPDQVLWSGPREITIVWNDWGDAPDEMGETLGFRTVLRTRSSRSAPASPPPTLQRPR